MPTNRQKRRNQVIWIAISIIAVLGMVVLTVIPLFSNF